jgi:hypothetical protein
MLARSLNFATFGTNSVQQSRTSETDSSTVDEEIPNFVQSEVIVPTKARYRITLPAG